MLDDKPIGRNQKLAAIGLAVFAVFLIVLWFAQLRNNIYGPFLSGGEQTVSLSADHQALINEQELRNKDTDSDGLSDWEELNIYRTSPYLKDSDSDGINDGEEIKNGTDPNCPRGRDCSGFDLLGGGQAAAPAPDAGLDSLLNQSGSLNSLSGEQVQALENIDAASLRQLLLLNGMQKEVLDKISDAELMQSYGEVLQP